MNTPPRFEVEGLCAGYAQTTILSSIHMPILEGQVTAILGPSGCGKSTLLRCLNRMHETSPGAFVRGVLRLQGQDIYAPEVDATQVRRQIGMVFQKPNPFPAMTIRQNVLAGFRLRGQALSPSSQQEVVQRALREAGLWDEVKDRLNASGMSLSGGQQQRLCIARALATKPHVLLMDEPTSALDPAATEQIEQLIASRRGDYTIVLVTHSMAQARRVSDQVAYMLRGQLVEHGPCASIFDSPQDPRTADFIQGRLG